MALPFILLGLLLGGILTIVSLVFTIIYLANWNQRKFTIAVSCFVASLAVIILSVITGVQKGKEKVKNFGSNVRNWAEQMEEESKSNRSDYQNEKMDSLKAWEPEQYKDSVNDDFYETYSHGTYRIPLVFPYSIASFDESFENAFLKCELTSKKSDSLNLLKNITDITFDRNYLIARIDNGEEASENQREVFYILFHFSTAKCTEYPNQTKAITEAEKSGYTGRQYLQKIQDVYSSITY